MDTERHWRSWESLTFWITKELRTRSEMLVRWMDKERRAGAEDDTGGKSQTGAWVD